MGTSSSLLLYGQWPIETFITRYLYRRGPVPDSIELIPGGSLNPNDDPLVIRYKFQMALKKQTQLTQILYGIDKKVNRCLSPCIMADFSLEGSLNEKDNMYDFAYEGGEHHRLSQGQVRGKSLERRDITVKRSGLGTLVRLVSSSTHSQDQVSSDDSSESIQTLKKTVRREKRSRSRPEHSAVSPSSKRTVLSATQIRDQQENAQVTQSESDIKIEKIEIGGKRSKKSWPSKAFLRSVLSDPNNRPTTFFLARFRPILDADTQVLQEPVEVDYRYNNETGEEAFACKGPFESFLDSEERAKYYADNLNNNMDQKVYFLKNAATLLNKFDARIYWNGFHMNLDGADRMKVESIEMHPPTLVFDMSGLKHISASRNFSKMCVKGLNEEGDGPSRSFVIQGKSENEIRKVTINHQQGTVLVSVGFPLVSTSVSRGSSSDKIMLMPSKGILKETKCST